MIKMTATRWKAILRELPCLIGLVWPSERHNCGGRMETNHLTSIAQRTTDDLRSIRMCFNHHQRQSPLPVGEAYHKGSRKFREKYGSDEELLALQQRKVEEYINGS